MKSDKTPIEDALPIQLKIRMLESELDRVVSDLERLGERKERLMNEIAHYEQLLSKTRRQQMLRRIK